MPVTRVLRLLVGIVTVVTVAPITPCVSVAAAVSVDSESDVTPRQQGKSSSKTPTRLPLRLLRPDFTHNTAPCPECVTLQADIQQAIDAGQHEYAVPFPASGIVYDFGSTSLELANAVDFSLVFPPPQSDGSRLTLVFDIGGGLKLTGCVRATVVGAVVDYHPTLAQGTVVDTNFNDTPPTFTADFDPAFLAPNPSTTPFFNTTQSVKVAFWDAQTRAILRENTSIPGGINTFAKTYTMLSGWRYKISLSGNLVQLPKAALEGKLVTVFPRGGRPSVLLSNCTACLVANVSIHGGSSMAVVDSDGGGGNTYTHLEISRSANSRSTTAGAAVPTREQGWSGLPPRLLSVNADGFHSTTNAVGPSLLDSEVAFTGDDLGNICCAMSVLLPPRSATALAQPAATQPLAPLFVDVGGNLAHAVPGDLILFYNISTGATLGSATVAGGPPPRPTHDPAAVAELRAAFATMMAPPISAKFVKEVEHFFEQQFPVEVPLTAAVPDWGLWAVGVLQSTANARVERCRLHDG
eukprot:m.243037 g.243037  ORF g.243037 m.243037 type:complete len:523 (+) comp15832_c0_seq2:91-1659(+)